MFTVSQDLFSHSHIYSCHDTLIIENQTILKSTITQVKIMQIMSKVAQC